MMLNFISNPGFLSKMQNPCAKGRGVIQESPTPLCTWFFPTSSIVVGAHESIIGSAQSKKEASESWTLVKIDKIF